MSQSLMWTRDFNPNRLGILSESALARRQLSIDSMMMIYATRTTAKILCKILAIPAFNMRQMIADALQRSALTQQL